MGSRRLATASQPYATQQKQLARFNIMKRAEIFGAFKRPEKPWIPHPSHRLLHRVIKIRFIDQKVQVLRSLEDFP